MTVSRALKRFKCKTGNDIRVATKELSTRHRFPLWFAESRRELKNFPRENPTEKGQVMKIHFGYFENFGDYEYSMYGCESTICGHQGENVTEKYTVDDWGCVTCKKCLKLKDKVIAAHKADEEEIVKQM